MKSFKENAKECADAAVKFKKKFMRLCYCGIAGCLICFGIFICCLSAGLYFSAVVFLIISSVFGRTAYKCRRESNDSFNRLMVLRDESLDLDKKYRGY